MAEKALLFDGDNDLAADDDSTKWMDGAEGTMECWCTVDVTGSTPSQYCPLMIKHQTGYTGPRVYLYTNGTIQWSYKGTTTARSLATGVLSWVADTWYYIVCTWGVDGMEIWRNNVREAHDAGITEAHAEYGNGLFTLGWIFIPWWHKGKIDEVRISDTQRTSAEIATAWNGGNGTPFEVDGNTLALWHLNEGANGIAYDETVNDHDLAIDGASWVDGFPFVPPVVGRSHGYIIG